MKMDIVTRRCLTAVTAAICMNANATLVCDGFDTAHNFLTDGVAGTIWDGFLVNFTNGNTVVTLADANVSSEQCLTFQSAKGRWEHGNADGILLFKMAAGDFDAQVRVVSMNNVQWHDAGLMARVPEPDDAGPGEDWVTIKHAAFSSQNGHRSVDNGVTSTREAAGLQPWLRLVRSSNLFTTYRSQDGVTWTLVGESVRNDMDGLAVQVGIWHATFNDNSGTAVFDNFTLRSPTIWLSATNSSWASAADWSLGAPSGQGDWAILPSNFIGSAAITLDGDRTLGRLTIDSPALYSIDPGALTPDATLALDDTAAGAPTQPSIAVLSGNHAVNVPVVLSNGLNASVSLNAGLTLNKSVYGTGSLIKSGAGSLILASTNRYDGDTVVNGGLLKLVPLPDGTQAYYTFDDPNHLGADSSARDNHLVVGTGSPTYSDAGVFGGALYVDGSSTLIRQTFPAGVPTGNTPYTIALWMRDDGSPNTGGFCGWGNNANNQCNNLRLNGAYGLNNYWYGNDFILGGLSTNLKDGEWHHIAVTWDGLTQTMYVDGVPVGTSSRTGLNAQGINFVVGKTTSDAGFKGYIDNLLIADRAFTAAGIAAIMQTLMHSGSNDLLPPESALHLATGGVLDLNGADQSFSSLNGVGRVMNSSPAAVTLTVGSGNTDCTFGGTIDGPVALTKIGSGSLALSGINGHQGGTTVATGTLVLTSPSIESLLATSHAWFDAADSATLTTNAAGQVTLWTNKGAAGAALDAEQIVPGAGPTVTQNALNGLPVLSVDGTTSLKTKTNLGIAGAANRTLFAVGNRRNNSSNFIAHVGGNTDRTAFGLASQRELFFAYTWGPKNDMTFPARPNGVCELYDFVIDNGTATATAIGPDTFLSKSIILTPNTTDTPMTLGSRFTATCWGDVAEVILFNRALTPPEMMGVSAYLRAKWLISGAQPMLSAGNFDVAAGAFVDLDETAQTITNLSGDGCVSNGTLTVNGLLTPGGIDTLGTLTLATDTVLDGATLLFDATSEGACDRLVVQGSLSFVQATLTFQNEEALVPGKRYLIATFPPGMLSGSLTPAFTTANKWTLSANAETGELSLISRGLLLILK